MKGLGQQTVVRLKAALALVRKALQETEDVRLALKRCSRRPSLAAADLAVPTGIAYFGANSPVDPVFEVAALSPQASESAKALIAGYEGSTSQEFLDWGLRKAEETLRPRPEKPLHLFTRLVVCR